MFAPQDDALYTKVEVGKDATENIPPKITFNVIGGKYGDYDAENGGYERDIKYSEDFASFPLAVAALRTVTDYHFAEIGYYENNKKIADIYMVDHNEFTFRLVEPE